MIVSKFRTRILINFFIIAFFCLLLFVLVCLNVYLIFLPNHGTQFGIKYDGDPVNMLLIMLPFLLLPMSVFLFTGFRQAYSLKIDLINKTIWFKHLLLRKEEAFNFNDFDGYVEYSTMRNKGGCYTYILLIKDKRAIKIILDYYYSNFDEIKVALSEMKQLELPINGNWDNLKTQMKIFGNRPFIK